MQRDTKLVCCGRRVDEAASQYGFPPTCEIDGNDDRRVIRPICFLRARSCSDNADLTVEFSGEQKRRIAALFAT